MAKNQTSTQTVQVNVKNSKILSPISKVVELVVVNGALVPDMTDINAGVNSKEQ